LIGLVVHSVAKVDLLLTLRTARAVLLILKDILQNIAKATFASAVVRRQQIKSQKNKTNLYFGFRLVIIFFLLADILAIIYVRM
jgi:hypothetical protein